MNIDETPDPSYADAPQTFQGLPVAPYSLGNKMLLGMIARTEDPDSFFFFCLLYVLTQPRAEVQREAAQRDVIRSKILDWLDGLNLTPEQVNAAESLAASILKKARRDKVDPVAEGEAGNG